MRSRTTTMLLLLAAAAATLLFAGATQGAKPPPQAGSLTRALAGDGFMVSRGYPMTVTQADCEQHMFPTMGNCYGNNPASPYVVPVVQSWDDEFVDPAMVDAIVETQPGYSATYRLDPREALVVFGQLPPAGRYMGLQSYVFTRGWLTEAQPWNGPAYAQVKAMSPDLVDFLFSAIPGNPSRIQSFSSLSNPINNVVIERQSGAAFGQIRYFVITPDQGMDKAVRAALGRLGVPSENIFTEAIPPRDALGEIGPLGLDAAADDFVTLLRYAMPNDQQAADAWLQAPPLTVLRVRERASSQRPAEPFPAFVADTRTAVDEAVYAEDLDTLVRQVCQRWGQPCDPAVDSQRLRRGVDLQLQLGGVGPKCRAVGMDCLGDGQDASYFFLPARPFDPASAYAVVGTLGTATGNATYVGLSMNDMSLLKGVLNVRDTELAGSAASYASKVGNADKLFLHYFSRNCDAIASLTDGQCTTVTTDMVPPVGAGKQGLFATGLRAYVRPGTERGPLSSQQLKPFVIQLALP